MLLSCFSDARDKLYTSTLYQALYLQSAQPFFFFYFQFLPPAIILHPIFPLLLSTYPLPKSYEEKSSQVTCEHCWICPVDRHLIVAAT